METKTEIWKDIEGYEDLYQVSNFGRVRSLDRHILAECALSKTSEPVYYFRKGKVLTPHLIGKTGYIGVMLSKYNIPKNMRVHRLVAQAFIPNTDNLPEVNHIDEDKLNNCVWNLEWCTRKDNEHHGTKIERAVRNRNLKQVEALNDRGEIVATFDKITDAAKAYGVTVGTIWQICNGIGTAKTCKGLRWRYKQDTT
jgi:hypothetical protein